MKTIYLKQFEKNIRIFLSLFLITLSIGVSLGLVFLYHTTSFNPNKTSLQLSSGSEDIDEFEFVAEKNSSVAELLMTTHNHIIGFSFIFFFTSIIFYFNRRIKGRWKTFFMIEPMISIPLSFLSLWGVKLIHPSFIYITVVSSTIMYLSFYFMIAISLIDLNSE